MEFISRLSHDWKMQQQACWLIVYDDIMLFRLFPALYVIFDFVQDSWGWPPFWGLFPMKTFYWFSKQDITLSRNVFEWVTRFLWLASPRFWAGSVDALGWISLRFSAFDCLHCCCNPCHLNIMLKNIENSVQQRAQGIA